MYHGRQSFCLHFCKNKNSPLFRKMIQSSTFAFASFAFFVASAFRDDVEAAAAFKFVLME